MSEKKRYRIGEAVVNLSSMKLELAEHVVAHAEVAQKEQMLEMDVAQELKARLTKAMPDYVWQVFVGRNFGAYVTAEEGKYIYFYIGQVSTVARRGEARWRRRRRRRRRRRLCSPLTASSGAHLPNAQLPAPLSPCTRRLASASTRRDYLGHGKVKVSNIKRRSTSCPSPSPRPPSSSERASTLP